MVPRTPGARSVQQKHHWVTAAQDHPPTRQRDVDSTCLRWSSRGVAVSWGDAPRSHRGVHGVTRGIPLDAPGGWVGDAARDILHSGSPVHANHTSSDPGGKGTTPTILSTCTTVQVDIVVQWGLLGGANPPKWYQATYRHSIEILYLLLCVLLFPPIHG
jgi:hypothetical protein